MADVPLYDRLSPAARYALSQWVEGCAMTRHELFFECPGPDLMPHAFTLAETHDWPTEEDGRLVLDEALAARNPGKRGCLPLIFKDLFWDEVAGLLGLSEDEG